jgi:outer membrane immunogenic protein
MKKFLLGTAAALLLGAPIQAADIPVKAAPVVVQAFSWTGCYIGGHGGGGRTRSDWESVPAIFNAHPRGDGGVAGGHVGCNFQSLPSWLVVGLEADLDWANLKGHGNWSTPGFVADYEANWLASMRGRMGFAFDRVLLYATAGLGVARWQHVTTPCQGCTGFKTTDPGWVAGGGGEYAFTNQWSARVEYLHYDFRSISPINGIDGSQTNVRTKVDVVRGGLSYKFWATNAVVARY